MKNACPLLVIAIGAICWAAEPAATPSAQQGAVVQHPYGSLAPRVTTRLRFVTDAAFPGGPALQIKVYDWVIGARQEIPNFPLEGFATIEVTGGVIETTIDGRTERRGPGEHWIVPEGARLDIRNAPEGARGDNLVTLHGVVVIRR